MKALVMIIMFVATGMCTIAQSNGAVTGKGQNGTGGTRQTSTTGKKSTKLKVAQHHGAHDYTPGSPIGTGGAGDNMSGSRKNSAMETALDKEHTAEQAEQTTEQADKKINDRKATPSRHKKVTHKTIRKGS